MTALKRVYMDLAEPVHTKAVKRAKELGYKSTKAYLESLVINERSVKNGDKEKGK